MVNQAPRDKAKHNKAIKDLKQLLSKEKNESIQYYLEGVTPTKATDFFLMWKAIARTKKMNLKIVIFVAIEIDFFCESAIIITIYIYN